MRILLVDDNYDAIANTGDYLEMKGYEVDYAYHGQGALECLSEQSFDLVVLDIMMPGMDGLSVCDAIRQSEQAGIPIIFVTARDTLDDKLAGFAAGGDDYMVKPFALAELDARIQALIARYQKQREKKLEYAGLMLDQSTNQVFYHQQFLPLDPTQKRIVRLLLVNAPALVLNKEIAYQIWQDEVIDSSALRTQIYRLRKALPEGLLVTERGKGYRINDKQQ